MYSTYCNPLSPAGPATLAENPADTGNFPKLCWETGFDVKVLLVLSSHRKLCMLDWILRTGRVPQSSCVSRTERLCSRTLVNDVRVLLSWEDSNSEQALVSW